MTEHETDEELMHLHLDHLRKALAADMALCILTTNNQDGTGLLNLAMAGNGEAEKDSVKIMKMLLRAMEAVVKTADSEVLLEVVAVMKGMQK